MSADPVLESSGAQRPTEESIAAADVLGGGERLAAMTDGLMVMPVATAEAVGSSEAAARVTDVAP